MKLVKHFRRILNHHEFVAAAVRNGDLDEKLLRNSEKAAYVELYKSSSEYIYRLRNNRDRQSLYEHLEWLHNRWANPAQNILRRFLEYILGFPI